MISVMQKVLFSLVYAHEISCHLITLSCTPLQFFGSAVRVLGAVCGGVWYFEGWRDLPMVRGCAGHTELLYGVIYLKIT